MQVEVLTVREDYNKFFKYYFRKKGWLRLYLLALFSLLFAATRDTRLPFVLSIFLFKALIAAVILFFAFGLLPYIIARFKFNKALKNKLLTEPKIIATGDEGITITTGKEVLFWRWETLKEADILKEYIFFSLFTGKLYLLPLRCFASENEAINFLGIFQNGILKVRGDNKYRKKRNLYYWGLIGFIPNFGVIAGIVLTFKGIKHNDKKLMLIGTADIAFTFLFWTVMFHYFPK